ncbi:MAG: hypothetical protein HQM10_15980 [Candidatus Riflebacteria bacterium]|nr:hypothetical protein [Candidatus Riflebacteria bacterium]
MGFFERVVDYFKADPTQSWPVSMQKELIFNFADRTVNGATFENSFRTLEVFGKPNNDRPLYDRIFQYFQHGLVVELENEEKIDFFAFVFQNDEFQKDEHFVEAKASFVNAEGKILSLSKSTSMNDITVYMGDPRKIDEDPEETILFFKIDDLIIEWELTPAKNLKRVNIFMASKMIG